jgi:hypothetical protein
MLPASKSVKIDQQISKIRGVNKQKKIKDFYGLPEQFVYTRSEQCPNSCIEAHSYHIQT